MRNFGRKPDCKWRDLVSQALRSKHLPVAGRMTVKLIVGVTYGHRVDSFDDEVSSNYEFDKWPQRDRYLFYTSTWNLRSESMTLLLALWPLARTWWTFSLSVEYFVVTFIKPLNRLCRPVVLKLPSWFPGTAWKKVGAYWAKEQDIMVRRPYEKVKRDVVCILLSEVSAVYEFLFTRWRGPLLLLSRQT
jgi:hypothetical protein